MNRKFSPVLCAALTVLLTAAASAQSSPAPAITLITPSTAPAGTPGLGIAVNGANFQSGSVVAWNGSPVPTAYFSSTQMNASIPATFLANPAYVTITVINPGGVVSNGVVFTVTGSPLTISTTAIPQGVVGVAYASSLTATGGTAPYTWPAVSVAPGLVLNSAGVIAGTPTTAGAFNFTAQVADSAGQTALKTFAIAITGPQFSITTASLLPNGNTGQSYSQTLVASGGTVPYRWTVGTGLPPGLTVDPASGVISGIPTAGGTSNFTVQVTDAAQLSASRTFALTINSAPLKITTVPPLFTGAVGVAYAQTFTASGGTPPYRWTVLSGNPGELTLDATAGTLQGTPQTAGTFNFTVQVSDSAGAQASQPFSLVVNPPALTITTGSTLPSGTVGVSYRQTFGVVGGTAPYAWSLTSGSAPGLTLDSSGNLSGTPTMPGTFTLTLQAKDVAGLVATKTFTISISPASLTITTPTQLPDAMLGAPFSQTMTASGGATPYTWSTNGLPDGVTIDAASGVISGVPATAGTYSFTVRVIDAARTTYVDLFRINVSLPPTPSASLSGLPQTAQPAQQIPLTVSLDAAFPALISGQLVLSFAPDIGGGDSTIQFASGGRTADFTVPVGTMSAVSATPLALQTGTAAGTITVSLRLQAGGIDITPTPAPAVTTRVERAAPVIQSARLIRSGSGLSIEITGFSTAREVTQAAFTFSVAGQTSTIMAPVENLFNTWFQDPTSGQYGSQFVFTQLFTIQGDANAVTPQSVTLTNRAGSVSANVTQ
jgi:hypothetical protein